MAVAQRPRCFRAFDQGEIDPLTLLTASSACAVLRTVIPAITVRRVGEDYYLDPGEPGDLSLLLGRDPRGRGFPQRDGLGAACVIHVEKL